MLNLNYDICAVQKVLITGGAGFVGSSLALLFKEYNPGLNVYVFDNLKRKGSELNLPRLREKEIEFIHGDIRIKEDVETLPEVDVIIDACAEPSVLAGLEGSPSYLINTNLMGTVHSLELARRYKAAFIFLSTSRVYPIKTVNEAIYEESETRFVLSENQILDGISAGGISESFPLQGARSLYGATKLASELLLQEYVEFYELQAVINRCGVLAGPWQMGKVDQGFIVLWLAQHYFDTQLGYFGFGGKGHQVRDVLHVRDLFKLILVQLSQLNKHTGKVYNVGGGLGKSISLAELTHICQQLTGNVISIKEVKENRTADIRIYISDNSEVTSATGWQPTTSVLTLLQEVYEWISQHETTLKPILT